MGKDECFFFKSSFVCSADELRRALIQHIIKLAEEPQLDRAVCKRLSLCVAAMAIQLNRSGIVNEILSSLNALISSAPYIVLELLTVLPEECYDKRVFVDTATRHSFSMQLSQSVPDVFAFLHSLIAHPQSPISTKVNVLTCFGKWIDNVGISEEVLLSHPLFLEAWNALKNRQLFDEALEVVSIAIRRMTSQSNYQNRPQSNSVSFPQAILPKVLELRYLWSSDAIMKRTEDEDLCRSISRIFTETCEAFMDLFIVTDQDYHQLPFLTQLVECFRYPYDFDISLMPLNFLGDLNVVIKNLDNERKQILRSKYHTVYLTVLDISISHMQLNEVELTGSMKMIEEKRRARIDLQDMVLICSEFLGLQEAFQKVCGILQHHIVSASHASVSSWSLVESALYAMQPLGPLLPGEENQLLPQLMSLLPSLPNIYGISITVVRLIGKLSAWIHQNPTYLLPTFNYLCGCLSVPMMSQSAAGALMELCQACSSVASFPLLELHQQIILLRNTGNLSEDADTLLLEGICHVISALDLQAVADALKFVVEPVASSMVTTLDTIDASSAPPSTSLNNLVHNIDRLAAIFHSIRLNKDALKQYLDNNNTMEHPVMKIFIIIWPLLQRTLNIYNQSEYAAEKVCRCYKYMTRCVGKYFKPHLQSMTIHLAEKFRTHNISSYLYAGAVCVLEFGRDKVCTDMLYQMLWSFSDSFFMRFRSLNDFQSQPDVVEEYFYLLATAVELCPEPLLLSPQSTLLLDAGVTGLQLKHRESQKGILLFFERLVEVPSALGEDNPVVMNALFKLLGNFAVPLVTSLFQSLSGELPAYAFDESYGSITDVLWSLLKIAPHDFQVKAFIFIE